MVIAAADCHARAMFVEPALYLPSHRRLVSKIPLEVLPEWRLRACRFRDVRDCLRVPARKVFFLPPKATNQINIDASSKEVIGGQMLFVAQS
jgi:hypothetical protein